MGCGMRGAALASGFIKNHGAGGSHVERADGASHGNAQKVVAGAADEVVKASALPAENDDKIAGEIELVVVRLTPFVEARDPQIVAFEFFKGTHEIDDACDAKVLGRTGAGLHGGGTQGSGAALGNNYAVDACAVGHAQQGAEVLRIFNAIERENKPSCALICGRLEKVLEGKKFMRAHQRNHALMRRGLGSEGELVARLFEDANAGLAALGDETFKTRVMALAGDQDMIEAPLAGFECFLHRVQAVENFHQSQCTARNRKGAGNRRPVRRGKIVTH